MKNSKFLSNTELSLFCLQTYHLFKAGITPADGMEIILEDASDSRLKQAISEIKDCCMIGEPFSEACKKTGVFPEYVINMISLGEESGHLTEIMSSLSKHYEREQTIADSIKDAVRYPLIMIAMMFLVVIVLIAKVLPIFNQVFIQLGADMTGFAKSLLSVSEALSKYSFVLLVVLLVIILIALFLTKSATGKHMLSNISSHLPFGKSIKASISAGRFASGMAMTFSSGLDAFQSLDLIKLLIENEDYKRKIEVCKAALSDGDTFPEALKRAKIFSTYYSHMVIVGSRTGNLDLVMNRIADDYENETEDKIRSLISTLEPTLVIILSMFVGLVLLSVILPLLGVMSMIG